MKKITRRNFMKCTAMLGAAAALTACGADSAVSETASSAVSVSAEEFDLNTISAPNTVFAWWGNQARNESTVAALDLFTEKYPGVTFDGQADAWDDYWIKMSTYAAGNMLPTVMQQDYAYIKEWNDNGLLVDLNPYVESGILDLSNCTESVIESGRIDGKLVAVCAGVNAPALFYNKAVVEAAGVNITNGMKMADFIDACRTIYEKTGYHTDLGYPQPTGCLIYAARVAGGHLYGDKKLGCDKSVIEEYFTLIETAVKEGWHCDPVLYNEYSWNSLEQYPIFWGEGKASWCNFANSNQLATARVTAASYGIELGMVSFPCDDPAKGNYLKPAMFYSVCRDANSKELGAAIIDYFTNDIDCNNILLGERGVPVSTVVADAIAPNMDEASREVIDYINNVISPNCSPIDDPDPSVANECTQILADTLEQMVYGQIDAATAAEQYYTQANALLSV